MAEALRILILEDNRADAELVQFELEEAAFVFSSKVVMTEEDFVRELQEFSPDLILSDYDLPKYSGALALAEASRRCPDTPFILVTGAVTEDRAIDILTQGAKDYVLKNRLGQRLAPAVRRALTEAEEHRARKRAEEELHEAHKTLEKQVKERTSELQESRERLSLTLTSSGMGTFEWDLVHNKPFFDDYVYFLHGIKPENFFGEPEEFFQAIHPDDRHAIQDAQKKAIEQYTPYETEYRVILPYGRVHHIAARGRVLWDNAGRPARIIGVCWDITGRKQAEEARRQSEERHRLLVETMLQGVVRLDATGKIITMNPAAERILGKGREQFLCSSLDEEEHHAIRENGERFQGMEHPAMVALRTGLPVHGVIMGVFNPKLGDYRWISIDAVPVFHPGETHPSEVYTVFEDITERQRVEKVLQANEVQLSNALEMAHLGHWEYDVADDLFTFNDHFYKIFRTTVEQVGGYTMRSAEYAHRFVHPDDMNLVGQEIKKSIETTDPNFSQQLEHRIRYADGTDGYISVRVFVVKDSQGRTVKTYGVNQDITERKRTEEIQRRNQVSAERLATEMAVIAEIGRVVGSTLNVDTVYERFASITQKLISFDTLSVNLIDATQNLFRIAYFSGPSPSERTVGLDMPIAGTLTDYVMHRRKAMIFNSSGPEEMARLHPEVTKSLSIHAGYHSSMLIPLFSNDVMIGVLHFRARNKNAYRKADLRLAEQIGMQIAGAIANAQMFNDLSNTEKMRAKLQDQLLQAQKMESIGRLAGGVAHDFNNMLGVILGHAEMALEQVDPTQLIHSDIQAIQQAANRSKELTGQLLAFARKQLISPKVIAVNKAVKGTLKMLQRLIGEDIHLSLLPGKDLWSVKIDPSQLDQILANLCVNARDAIAGVGKVAIETGNVGIDEVYCAYRVGCAAGDYVQIAVSDDGCGMDKDTLDKLFEPFFTTKELGKGTGLGLAMVYGIVKQNNGFIDVYSEPGQGTTFKIYLPRHVGKAEQPRTEGSQESLMRGQEAVLVVEDEPEILSLTKRMLEMQGYQVLTAGRPSEAIRVAKGHTGEIHLLMTDVVMPEMNGRDLAKKMLSIYPNIKRMFMSGYTADVIANQGVLDDGVHFIQKPFSMKDLATKVREALEQK